MIVRSYYVCVRRPATLFLRCVVVNVACLCGQVTIVMDRSISEMCATVFLENASGCNSRGAHCTHLVALEENVPTECFNRGTVSTACYVYDRCILTAFLLGVSRS